MPDCKLQAEISWAWWFLPLLKVYVALCKTFLPPEMAYWAVFESRVIARLIHAAIRVRPG